MQRRNPNTILPVVLISAGAILILGAALWFLNPFGSTAESNAGNPANTIPFQDVKRVSLADAKAAYDTKTAVFVDVRGEPYYSQEHIPGALSISLEDLPNRLGELNRADWIITYCT